MSPGILILVVVFAALLLLQTPIAFVIGIAAVLAAFALGYDSVLLSVARDLGNGLDSFALLAIPFFILAGDLMGAGGLARRLIDFAAALVGRTRGGLALVNTLTCMFFGAISGSAAAAVSSIGSTLIPEMNRNGYPKNFNIAVTVSAATTGLLIPPSNVMIVYAVVATNISIGALFMAGIVPGILIGFLIMVVCVILSGSNNYGSALGTVPPLFRSAVRAFPSLLLIVFVLGGILGGIFTATEASAVAVLWAFLLGVIFYREIPLKALPQVLLKSGRTTGIVLLLVAASLAMSRILTQEQVPQMVSNALLGLSNNPLLILLTINLILLVVGTFMDMTPAILVFTPIFLPVAIQLGIDPVHFGIILIANLCIGLCTPPVGTCLFLGCSVGRSNIMSVSRAMLPFYGAMVVGLLLITFIPWLSLWLPKLLGLLK
ncbi:MAG: TRAP transporter large permease [Verrucomicrobia bacterium]|nr:TRAP transporter large permease [Verrucomicrobiota bacterium]